MATLYSITIDCKDAQRLATFWAAALDGYMTDESGRVLKSENGPVIFFQEVPEGKSAKNRLHLDVGAQDTKAEVFRLTRLGASVLEEKDEMGHQWTIMADPEGNEFCVCPPMT
jgi:predicted enzyme related to lactoylglutathione lyase